MGCGFESSCVEFCFEYLVLNVILSFESGM